MRNISRFLFGALICLLAAVPSSARAQLYHPCNASDLVGAYGFSLKGTNTVANVPFAITGRFASGGKGALTGTATQSVNGIIAKMGFSATYAIDPDCTGTATLTFDDGVQASLSFVLVSDGREILFIDSDTGTVEQGSAKKMFSEKP